MRNLLTVLSLGVLLAFAGCGAKKESAAFEKKFAAAKEKSGLPDVQIIETAKGMGLKNNVQRLGDPVAPDEVDSAGKIPQTLSQNQVGRHIRRQLARLSECQESAAGRSGKALLTVKIQPNGSVGEVDVEAPSFSGTRLASCLREGAMRWRFPQFRSGALSYTYPFIFR
jgi:hypothetical protein